MIYFHIRFHFDISVIDTRVCVGGNSPFLRLLIIVVTVAHLFECIGSK